MLRLLLPGVFVMLLIFILCGCQTTDGSFKRAWDSVEVSDTPLFRVYQRAPLPSGQRTLPPDDYWYKYQDNYKPNNSHH